MFHIHTKCLTFVEEAFSNKRGFTEALEKVNRSVSIYYLFSCYNFKACQKFINNNPVTDAAGDTSKSSELLAQYCDIILRKGYAKYQQSPLKCIMNLNFTGVKV